MRKDYKNIIPYFKLLIQNPSIADKVAVRAVNNDGIKKP